MGKYTETIKDNAVYIDPDEDNYAKELARAVETFRRFDEAMDDFITEHGYTGDQSDADAKARFIKDKFKSANITPPRGIREWFTEHRTIERQNGFLLAFAFRLDIAGTRELFRRLCLGLCFDCHTVSEAVYYYCMRNGLSYENAEAVIKSVPKDVKGKISDEILYTRNIIEELHRINNLDELTDYLRQNIEQFGYNNATATKYIGRLWNEIAGENGLAYRTGVLKPNSSVWSVYLHILGLDDRKKSELRELKTDRSLKSVLKDNKLLHPLAAESFPDREGINRALNGEHLSHERIRKLLILLLFYRFWERRAAQKGSYKADYNDDDRCKDDINGCLVEAGYPELYCGNPYDWIFINAMCGDYPLTDFHFFVGELFAANSEQ